MTFFLGIDQGTTSSRAVIYNSKMEIVSTHSEPFKQIYPKADWVEHSLEDIWESVEQSIKLCLQKCSVPDFDAKKIVAIGITNQRETFGIWEKETGKPKGNAIVWQCRRSSEICDRLKRKKKESWVRSKTGLVLDPYFSATKLMWRFEHEPGLLKRATRGEICFGTIDTFLLFRLTKGKSFLTEPSNASRTLLMDLKRGQWCQSLLKLFGVPGNILPKIVDSNADFGRTSGLEFLPDGIPITGILGDQQAALFGQECLSQGEAKITYGTGAFFLLNTGSNIRKTKVGLSTCAWQINGKRTYALEGSVFIAGAAVQWLRDGLGLISKSSEIESLARTVPDSDGVFFIPALTGLGAPDWAPHARGLMGGFTRRSQKAHLAFATLEGIAFSIGDTFSQLLKDSKLKLKKLRVDGGASANNLLLEIQASDLRSAVSRPVDLESTVRGAATLAAIGAGKISNLNQVKGLNPVNKEFLPKGTAAEAKLKRMVWQRRKKALIQGAF
jgi:glycerol kinase